MRQEQVTYYIAADGKKFYDTEYKNPSAACIEYEISCMNTYAGQMNGHVVVYNHNNRDHDLLIQDKSIVHILDQHGLDAINMYCVYDESELKFTVNDIGKFIIIKSRDDGTLESVGYIDDIIEELQSYQHAIQNIVMSIA